MTVETLAGMICAFLVGVMYSDYKLERAIGRIEHEFRNVYQCLKLAEKERERV